MTPCLFYDTFRYNLRHNLIFVSSPSKARFREKFLSRNIPQNEDSAVRRAQGSFLEIRNLASCCQKCLISILINSIITPWPVVISGEESVSTRTSNGSPIEYFPLAALRTPQEICTINWPKGFQIRTSFLHGLEGANNASVMSNGFYILPLQFEFPVRNPRHNFQIGFALDMNLLSALFTQSATAARRTPDIVNFVLVLWSGQINPLDYDSLPTTGFKVFLQY